jgi:hypothetical protein
MHGTPFAHRPATVAKEVLMSRKAMRVALGLALILHGLGNAVLPLRGVDAGAPGAWIPALTALYIIAIIGFVMAGLGVLGVRPLTRAVIPAALFAGVCALGGLLNLAHAELWPGVLLNLTLPIAATLWVSITSHEVSSMRRGSRWRRLADVVGLLALAWIVASAVLWPWHRAWGTEPREWTMSLPGDHTPRNPSFELLHGVTIDAPPPVVWAWLVQLGQDRAGFYSYESLERLFGVDIHNVKEIRPEWQSRATGDRVYATQQGFLGGVFGDRPGWTVDLAEPNRALVLRYWGAFVLQPTASGGTRFLIRSTISNERIPVWAAALNFTAFELPHFIMQSRMMLNIKNLAEHSGSTLAETRW